MTWARRLRFCDDELVNEGTCNLPEDFLSNNSPISSLYDVLPSPSPPPPRWHRKSSFACTRGSPHLKNEANEVIDCTLLFSAFCLHLTIAIFSQYSHSQPSYPASFAAFNTLGTLESAECYSTPEEINLPKELLVHPN